MRSLAGIFSAVIAGLWFLPATVQQHGRGAGVGRVLCAALLALLAWPVRAEIQVTDFADRNVRLAQPAERIVALSPHIVENAFSAGAGDKLVGAVSYSDYPDAAADIPRVGSHQAWSLESVVALRPDLVLLWGSGNGLDAVVHLEQLGIPVYVSEPRQLADIPRSIRAIGRLAGTTAVSELEAARIEDGIEALASGYSSRPPVRVFYQIWHDPLQTINGEHLISKVIALCGGRNVFAAERPLAPRVSLESVLQADPEVILASGMGEARPDWLDAWQDYPDLRAVRLRGLLFVDPNLLQRPTARVLRGARSVCRQVDEVRERLPASGLPAPR
jgi:iron complex transport system substrate-binding protein